MRALNSVAVADDGIYATVGGGIEGKEFTHALWAHGKQTVTGMCECVGLTAVVLGGGHGLLQGYHGLLSDQVLSLNIVLANASVVTASETDHSELFWGMQGAYVTQWSNLPTITFSFSKCHLSTYSLVLQ